MMPLYSLCLVCLTLITFSSSVSTNRIAAVNHLQRLREFAPPMRKGGGANPGFSPVIGKSCWPCRYYNSFQNSVCAAHWVLYGQVKEVITNSEQKTEYKVKVIKVYKSKNDMQLAKMVTIHTTGSRDLCHVSMDKKGKYVLSGMILDSGELWTDMCVNLNYKPSETFPFKSSLAKSLRKNFLHNCNCKVDVVETVDESKMADKCQVTYEQLECSNHMTFCKQTAVDETHSSGCEWNAIKEKHMLSVCIARKWGVSGMGAGSRDKKPTKPGKG